jgi:hypothetical protein
VQQAALAALFTERPANWSFNEWGNYIDDIADELRCLREQAAAEGDGS